MPVIFRVVFTLVTAAAAIVAQPVSAQEPVWDLDARLSDTALGRIVGKAGPTTRLSVMVDEQASTIEQLLAGNMRNGFDNWFADGNVQRIVNANMLIR